MVELVDTHALGACAYIVGVQVLSSAPSNEFSMGKYYQNSHKQITFLQNVLNIQPTSTGVDLGCGEGIHLKALQKISSDIYGVDIQENQDLSNYLQLDFFVDDIPLQNLDFAYILSPFFDQNWWNMDSFLKRVYQSLRMHGQFILDLDFHTMRPGQRRSTYKVLESCVVLSTFTRELDRVNLDRTIIDFKGNQKKITGVWRIFSQSELFGILDSQGFMVVNQYFDFDNKSVINWDNDIQNMKRLIIQCKKY